MNKRLNIVVFGLSLSSSWGNGHATTYRSLLRGLAQLGHDVLFFERDQPWYAQNRDLRACPYAHLFFYPTLENVRNNFADVVRNADLIIVGSYVVDGAELGMWVSSIARGVTAFYDIDTPVTLAGLAAGDISYLSRDLVSSYDLYLSFTSGPALQYLERRYGAKMARALYCSVDPELYSPRSLEPRWDLGYMGTYSDDRQPFLEELLLAPARRWAAGRFIVAGPQYPKQIRWPGNVRRSIHVYPRKHPDFYAAQRFTLNITRAQMRALGYSPSVRLFEAAACGTPIISDDWAGLEKFFAAGSEILVTRSYADTLYYLQNISDEQRYTMAANARDRVLREHTGIKRASQLIRYFNEASGTTGKSVISSHVAEGASRELARTSPAATEG
jgi:spore maturation protein CgeB